MATLQPSQGARQPYTRGQLVKPSSKARDLGVCGLFRSTSKAGSLGTSALAFCQPSALSPHFCLFPPLSQKQLKKFLSLSPADT